MAIRVTFKRVPVYFPIGIDVSEEAFERLLTKPRISEELSEIQEKLNKEERAKKLIEKLGTFTFQVFREQFYKDDPARRKSRLSSALLTLKKPWNFPEMEYRHTMATVLKRAGVSTEFIKETWS